MRLRVSEVDDTAEDEDGVGGESGTGASTSGSSPGELPIYPFYKFIFLILHLSNLIQTTLIWFAFLILGGRGRVEMEDKRRLREMEETIRMKNKQIHQLLEDVEEVTIN